MKKVILWSLISLITATMAFAGEIGIKKKRPRPQDYGKVILNNFSGTNNMSPVEFDHWLHRSKFTCRLCHIDIGLAMETEATQITAADNINGLYCGTCHNDKTVIADTIVFKACFDEKPNEQCDRCHSYGNAVKKKKYDFRKFTSNFPRERFGNGINWEKTEKDGLIKLIDYIEGISIKRGQMPVQKDFSLQAQVKGLPDITFSHEKHTVWNGCEVCHPEIFIGVKKGTTKYSMIDIFNGKFCGVCHGKVAFPNTDCRRCHTSPI